MISLRFLPYDRIISPVGLTVMKYFDSTGTAGSKSLPIPAFRNKIKNINPRRDIEPAKHILLLFLLASHKYIFKSRTAVASRSSWIEAIFLRSQSYVLHT